MRCARCDVAVHGDCWQKVGSHVYCHECVIRAWFSEAFAWAHEAGADIEVVYREFERRLLELDFHG